MEPPLSPSDITGLLQQWQGGDRQALDSLIPVVYEELRVIASRHLSREWRPDSLQTTALVNEHTEARGSAASGVAEPRALLRARRAADASHPRRRRAPGAAAEARRRRAETPVDDVPLAAPAPDVDAVDALALDVALTKLEQIDPDQAKLVELRFFGGLTVEETAVVMGVSPATVKREWAVARGWLHRAHG